MSKEAIVLGIDPGLVGMGVVVARLNPKVMSGYDLLEVRVVSPKVASGKKRGIRQSNIDAMRAIQLNLGIVGFVDEYHPRAVFIELPLSGGVSACAVKGMAISMTAVVVTFQMLNIPMEWYDPFEGKRAALGVEKLPKGLDKLDVALAIKEHWPEFIEWPDADCNLFHTTDAAAVLLAARHSSLYTLLSRG